MNVLLTQPITEYLDITPDIPDLGLGYLAAQLMKSGIEVVVNDWNMDPSAENFRSRLIRHKPGLVGMKIFTKDVKAAKKTLAVIRETLPDTVIVLGGPHPSCSDPSTLMHDFPEADYAIQGEAELSLPMLVSAVKTGKQNPSSLAAAPVIPGLVWREGAMVKSTPVNFVNDLDLIDFPSWRLLNPEEYRGDLIFDTRKSGHVAPIVTTRGCPGRCSFCSAYRVNGRRIRRRSPENVIKEMTELYQHFGIRKFMFMDNAFTSDKEHLVRICQSIIDARMDIEWDCNCYEKLDNLTGKTLSLMAKAGCRMVHMGIESASERIRKGMNKHTELDSYTEKIRELKKYGIGSGTWFMIGFPDETLLDMLKTVWYAFSIDVNVLTFTICFPLPGSQVYATLKDNYAIETIDWSTFDILKSQYPVSRLTTKKLVLLLKGIRAGIRLKNAFKTIRSRSAL